MLAALAKQWNRSVAVLDLETTGTDPTKDRIMQFVIRVSLPSGESMTSGGLVNPGVPIPPGAMSIHGITDEMVRDSPVFAGYAVRIEHLLSGCVLSGFNIRAFDLPLLASEFARIGVSWDWSSHPVVDVFELDKRLRPRTLEHVHRHWTGFDVKMHDAASDVETAGKTLASMVTNPELWAMAPEDLAAWGESRDPSWLDSQGKIAWSDGRDAAVLTFGKHKGCPINEEYIDGARDYLEWVMKQDFRADTKAIIRDALNGKFPTKPERA